MAKKKTSLSELEKLIKKSNKGFVSKESLPYQKTLEDFLEAIETDKFDIQDPYNNNSISWLDLIKDKESKKEKETSKQKLQEENKKLKEQFKKEKTSKTKLKNKLEKENKKLKKEVEDLKKRNVKLNKFKKFDIIDLED